MKILAEKLLAILNAYDLATVELTGQWLEMLSFSDQLATASVFRNAINISVVAAGKGMGLPPKEMVEFIRRASVQLACWMWYQERSGIPIFVVADTAIDVGRHELLMPIQRHFAHQGGPRTVANTLIDLEQELAAIKNQLKVGARLACYRARRGLRTLPCTDDIIAVDAALSLSLEDNIIETTEVARDALESACERIYELGSEKFAEDQFYLPAGHLPSNFVVEISHYHLRHVLMKFVENLYSNERR